MASKKYRERILSAKIYMINDPRIVKTNKEHLIQQQEQESDYPQVTNSFDDKASINNRDKNVNITSEV